MLLNDLKPLNKHKEPRNIDGQNTIQTILNIYFILISCGLPLVVTNGYYNITRTKAFYYLFTTVIMLVSFVIFVVLSKSGKRVKEKKSGRKG